MCPSVASHVDGSTHGPLSQLQSDNPKAEVNTMNFEPTEEQRAIRDLAASFAADEMGSPASGGIGYYSDQDKFSKLHRNH